MRLWRLGSAVALLGVLFSAKLPVVQACTGVGYGTEELFKKSTIVVKATVQQVDDYGSNGILRVLQYFKGGRGTEFVVVAPLTPPLIDAELKPGYGLGDCSGLLELHLRVGQTAYFFLKRLDDGSFISPNEFNADFYSFEDGDVQIMQVFVNGKWIDKLPTEREFLNTLEKLSGSKPQLPTVTQPPYPLLSPLWIVTTKGTEFILPVDGGKPVKPKINLFDYDTGFPHYTEYRLSLSKPSGCFVANCTTVSRNGWFEFELTKDHTITQTGDEEVNGFLFEPLGRIWAIWKKDTLKIGQTLIPLSDSKLAFELAPKAVWSDDGSLFAYSDRDGLWLITYNYTDNTLKHRLLVATSSKGKILYPRYFSSYGKYLAISDGDNLSTLNLETNHELPDGIVSPDERHLLAFQHKDNQTQLALCDLLISDCNNLTYAGSLDGLAKWTSSESYLYVSCDYPYDKDKCWIIRGYIYQSQFEYPWINSGLYTEGTTFDYEPVSNALAVIKNKRIITINGVELDIRKYLDGDIADIRWWPSLLYKR